ncbi:MAG: extracellular solute-binding protein [Fimbriimonadaceae bacterium]|nr:extracellular solute-binding protein [Fimbriimonadaceae bacterium]
MSKFLCSVFLAVLACLCFGEDKDARGRTILTVWGLAISPQEKGQDAVVREFERRNPDLKVRLLSMGAGGMSPQKLLTAIVGEVPPDAVFQDRFTISDWAERGAFQSLDDLIARDRARDPETPTPDQYYPAVWQEACYNGKVYGIPTAADNRVLYYNRALFKKKAAALRAAGLDPDLPPRTWSETLAYSKVLTEKNPDGSLKVAGFMPNYGNSWLYLYSFQMNGEFMSPDGKRCTMDNPRTKAALDFMVQGYDILGGMDDAKKFEAGFRGNENDPFVSGQVAMQINGDWNIKNYSRWAPRLDMGTAPAPVPDDRYYHRGAFQNEKDTFITWAGGYAWVIPRGARHREAAWKWLKWVNSYEARLLNAREQSAYDRSQGRRYIPRIEAHIKATEDIVKEFAPGDSVFEQALRTHVSMMPFAHIRPPTFVAQTLWDEHVRAIEQATRHAQTSEEALRDGQAKVQKLIDEHLQRTKYAVVDLNTVGIIGTVIVLAAILVAFFLLGKVKLGRVGGQEARAGFLFISPFLVGFLIFTLGPMLASLVFSFTQYDVLNEARYVGMNNFVDIFNADRAMVEKCFYNVAYLAGIGIPLGIVTGLAIALVLNTGVRGLRFYRTAFYLPSITPAVATVFLWMWILNSSPDRGILNYIWQGTVSKWFMTPPPGWFAVEAWAKPSLIMIGLWGAGSGMILWLAGLKGVPTTLYEAASIDGASSRQQFFSITLPQLSPLIFFSSVMGVISVLQTFDSVFIITQGLNTGPNDSLAMPVYHLFLAAFGQFRMGYASAFAWVLFLIILALTGLQFVLSKRWVHYEVDK